MNNNNNCCGCFEAELATPAVQVYDLEKVSELIDEKISEIPDNSAANTAYDNTLVGIEAENVQDAIDLIVKKPVILNGDPAHFKCVEVTVGRAGYGYKQNDIVNANRVELEVLDVDSNGAVTNIEFKNINQIYDNNPAGANIYCTSESSSGSGCTVDLISIYAPSAQTTLGEFGYTTEFDPLAQKSYIDGIYSKIRGEILQNLSREIQSPFNFDGNSLTFPLPDSIDPQKFDFTVYVNRERLIEGFDFTVDADAKTITFIDTYVSGALNVIEYPKQATFAPYSQNYVKIEFEVPQNYMYFNSINNYALAEYSIDRINWFTLSNSQCQFPEQSNVLYIRGDYRSYSNNLYYTFGYVETDCKIKISGSLVNICGGNSDISGIYSMFYGVFENSNITEISGVFDGFRGTLGDNAFYYCFAYTGANYDDSDVNLDITGLFANCNFTLDFVNYPNSLYYFMYEAYKYKGDISNIFDNFTILSENSNLNIHNFSSAFYYCYQFTGESPMIDGKKLWELTEIPDNNSNSCFYNCTGLSDYNEIPDNWK